MGFRLSIRRFTFSKVNNEISISNFIAFADQLHDLISSFPLLIIHILDYWIGYKKGIDSFDSRYHLQYFHDIIVLIILLTLSANDISAHQNIDRQLGSKFRLGFFFVSSFLYHERQHNMSWIPDTHMIWFLLRYFYLIWALNNSW